MTEKVANLVQTDLGNTQSKSARSSRPRANKRWVFTWNNYSDQWEESILGGSNGTALEGFIIGREIGESGTKHLQGYLEFKSATRPLEGKKYPKEIHWEYAKGNRVANVAYCSKDGDFIASSKYFRPPPKIRTITQLRPWQQDLENLIKEEPDDRTIHWIWERTGGIGKSALVKYLCVKHDALVCAGKAADMKYLVSSEEIAPSLIIFDVPRTSLNYISYTGIEEIKNGCFANSKYESKMYIMNSPHVLVFANEPPCFENMSQDRWNVIDLNHLTE